MIYILAGLVAGIATPTQTSINGKLRENNRSAYLTTVTSFGGAVVVLIIIALFSGEGLAIPFAKILEKPMWIWSGGLCGTVIVFMNMICLPKLGSANTVVLVSTGQIITGLVIDQFGIFESPLVRMDAVRTAGAALVILGVILVSKEKRAASGSSLPSEDGGSLPLGSGGSSKLPYIIGALAGGAGCGIQVAVNGTLSTVTGSSVHTTLLSMSIGLLLTVLIIAVLVLARGRDVIFDYDAPPAYDASAAGSAPAPERSGYRWWMFTGGIFGVVIVFSNAVIAPHLGAGLVTVLNLVGMMGAGLMIDAIGFLGIEKKPVTGVRILGMASMIAGTVMISFI